MFSRLSFGCSCMLGSAMEYDPPLGEVCSMLPPPSTTTNISCVTCSQGRQTALLYLSLEIQLTEMRNTTDQPREHQLRLIAAAQLHIATITTVTSNHLNWLSQCSGLTSHFKH